MTQSKWMRLALMTSTLVVALLGVTGCPKKHHWVTTGMVFVNHPTWTTPDLSFGGIKDSG